jgi:hypothetical protein
MQDDSSPMIRSASDGPLAFHPGDPAFNRANALYLAVASDIAYHRAPAALARERLGLETFSFRSRLTRARGFLGVCDTHAVLAFRGSEPLTLPNWLTVAIVRLVACGDYEGRVHHGFHVALQRTWNRAKEILDGVQDKPLFLTGHSMGGALSVLAATRLARLGRAPVATYTYGAPRVGDLAFCNAYALPTYRVVNRLDLVPELPLASSKRILATRLQSTRDEAPGRAELPTGRRPCYGHVNTLVYIDRDGGITADCDVRPWHTEAVAQALATRGKSFLDGIGDHLIQNYIRSLEGQADGKQTGNRRRAHNR